MDVNEVDYIKIGQRIRAARLKLGWQQAEVAFRAGLTTSHMSHIETGQTKVALPTIVKIANTLSVSVDELLCDSLEQVKPVYDKKIAEELADCDAAELQAMLEIMEIGVWTPIWWYDTEFGEMAQTKFEEFELSEKYGRWIQCLRDHEPIIVPDVEAIKEEMPDEYMLYRRLDANAVMAVPFWKGPTGFLTLRNAKKYKNQTGFLRMLNYAVISSLNEYFLLETRKLTIISPRITNATDVYISLFGELKITTEKGVLTEQELKSPKIARLLVYLLLKGKMTASPREIASAIWPGEDIEATVKNIKGLVYRFRQTFELLSDHRLIESTPTGYQINPRLNVFTDFQLFDKKWSIAMKAADHIIDDDRRLNAERLEAAFYSGRQATPEPVQPVTQESSTDDKELLLKLLQNPEMAALLKSLAKTL